MIKELQDLPTGRYTRDLLDALVGQGNYTLKSAKLSDIARSNTLMAEITDILMKDKTLSLASVNDEKISLLWFHDYPGWMAFAQPLGIEIKPSGKIAKRLTVLTRLAYLTMVVPSGSLNVRVVTVDDYADTGLSDDVIVKMLDGANVVAEDVLETMITNGREKIEQIFKTSIKNEGNPWLMAQVTRRVDEAGSHSIRFLNAQGQVKGDCFVAPREQMGGYDLIYFEDNLKDELKSTNVDYLLLEPHPRSAKHTVYSDDQSLSWLGEWLFPNDQLTNAMMDLVDITYNSIKEGKWPKFFSAVDLLDDPTKTLSGYQKQMLMFDREGLGLGSSIFLLNRISQGIISHLTSKRRFPIPCAMFAHVATDAWLHLAGVPDEAWPYEDGKTPRGSVWYCERFDRMVYNDEDFADLYDRHGGWDLDDTIKAHARTWRGEKKWILVRSPNSFGEYDIKDYIEGTYAPAWERADGTKLEFPEVGPNRPEFLEELEITYSAKDGLSSKSAPPVRYEPYQVVDSLKRAISFLGVFGRRANADMVYYHTLSNYRREQLTSIEEIVDACTQEQTDEAREAIDQDTEDILNELVEAAQPIDRVFWLQRIGKLDPRVKYTTATSFSRLTGFHQAICSLSISRYFELAQSAVERIDPVLFDLGKPYRANARKLVSRYYELTMQAKDEEESSQEFFTKVNDKLCAILSPLEDHVRHSNVLAIARHCYTVKRGNQFKDTILFQASDHWNKPSMFEMYIEAIKFFGIGDNEWFETAHCPECDTLRVYEDRVKFQHHLIKNKCEIH